MSRAREVLLSACCSALLIGCELDAVFKIDVADLASGSASPKVIQADINMPMSPKVQCQGPEVAAILDRYFDAAEVKFCGTRIIRTITGPNGHKRTERLLDRDSEPNTGFGRRNSKDARGNYVSEKRYAVAFIEGSVSMAFEGARPAGFFSLRAERSGAGGPVMLSLFIDSEMYSEMLYQVAEFSNATFSDSDGKKYALIEVGAMEIALFNSTEQPCRVKLDDPSAAGPALLQAGETGTYRISASSEVKKGELVSEFTEGVAALQVEGCI